MLLLPVASKQENTILQNFFLCDTQYNAMLNLVRPEKNREQTDKKGEGRSEYNVVAHLGDLVNLSKQEFW